MIQKTTLFVLLCLLLCTLPFFSACSDTSSLSEPPFELPSAKAVETLPMSMTWEDIEEIFDDRYRLQSLSRDDHSWQATVAIPLEEGDLLLQLYQPIFPELSSSGAVPSSLNSFTLYGVTFEGTELSTDENGAFSLSEALTLSPKERMTSGTAKDISCLYRAMPVHEVITLFGTDYEAVRSDGLNVKELYYRFADGSLLSLLFDTVTVTESQEFGSPIVRVNVVHQVTLDDKELDTDLEGYFRLP